MTRGGQRVKLEPRTTRVLQCLVDHAGEVVSVEQLLDAVWKDVVVGPESVYQAIGTLRRALGDDSKEPVYIANVMRRGYRLIAPTAFDEPPSGSGPTSVPVPAREDTVAPAARRGAHFPAIVVGALAVAAVGAFWFLRERSAAEHPTARTVAAAPRSVAVLPFADLSETKDQEYFADGMAEAVLDILARVPSLTVIGRTSSFQFKGRNEDLRDIGAKLGAAYLVEGSVRKVDRRFRITAQLIDASSGKQVWADNYDRAYGDVLAVQDQIASSIGRALQVAVGADEARPPHPLTNTEAYTFYLRGRWALDRGDERGLREAVADLEHSLALDPDSAEAAESLAWAHLSLIGSDMVPVDAGWPQATAASQAALRIDPKSVLAHVILGLKDATYDYDWRSATAELDSALAAHPRDAIGLYNASWLAFDLGRHDEAVRLSELSLSIDPLNPDALQNSAYIYFLVGNLDAAERDIRRSIAISPTFSGSHKALGQIFLQRGQPEAALVEMQAETSEGRDIGLALAYHALGRHVDSDAALARATQRLADLAPVDIAIVHAYRGERDAAFEWLEKAVAQHDLALGHKLRDEPKLKPLRDDPRYKDLLQKIHWPG
jgi:TolB-like protein/DNA-binding winged helix-turn-helix (wHTH) protein/Tfp pilus assembly protein PilF